MLSTIFFFSNAVSCNRFFFDPPSYERDVNGINVLLGVAAVGNTFMHNGKSFYWLICDAKNTWLEYYG